MTEPTKPALTVEQEFEKYIAANSSYKYPYLAVANAWTVWQASRRHTLGEVIREMRKEADAYMKLSETSRTLRRLADKFEAELKAETGQ